MGSFLQQVQARQNAPEAIAHRVALFLSSAERRAVIVEADDDAYFYSALLRRHKSHLHVEFFNAAGRSKVISALGILSNLGKSNRSFGVVDRDFHLNEPDWLVDNRCLILDVYSYENYFMNIETIFMIGKAFFGLEPESQQLSGWLLNAKNFLKDLEMVLTHEHAIGLWCRESKKNCNFNNFNVASYIKVRAFGKLECDEKICLHFIKETSADINQASHADFSRCEARLLRLNVRRRFRGHYFWTLFVRLLNAFRENLDAEWKTAGRSRARTRAEISERHALEAATPFLTSPSLLEHFFARILA